MLSRRTFLRQSAGLLGTGTLVTHRDGLGELAAASAAVADRTPDEVAQDESYWRDVQTAFSLDRV